MPSWELVINAGGNEPLIGPAIGALPGIHLPFAAYATLLVAGPAAAGQTSGYLRVDGLMGPVKAQGHQVIDDAPRPGSRGTTVAFIHPKTAFGTLIELVQE